MYKSRRVPFSLFVNIPLTTPTINFRISECHHRFSIDLIVIFSAKNGKLFLDHTDPLKLCLLLIFLFITIIWSIKINVRVYASQNKRNLEMSSTCSENIIFNFLLHSSVHINCHIFVPWALFDLKMNIFWWKMGMNIFLQKNTPHKMKISTYPFVIF